MKIALKILKWVGIVLLLVLLAVLAGGIAVQSPKVQSYIGRKVVERLQKGTDAEISYGSLAIQIPEAIVLKDVIVKDKAPKVEGADTVASIGHLSARFSLKGAIKGGGGVYIDRARLQDASFTLAFEEDSLSETGSRMNFMRVFGLESKESESDGWGDVLSAGNVDIESFHFRMINPPAEEKYHPNGTGHYPGVINFNDLDVVIDRLKARHLKVKDSYITATADTLRFHEMATGFTVHHASGKVKVGKERVRIDNFMIRDNDSDLRMDRFQLDGPIEAYDDFTNRIRITADIKKGSVYSMATAAHFGPGMENMTFKTDLDGKVKGYVNDFSIENLNFREHGGGVSASVKGSIMAIEDIEKSLFNLSVKNLGFTMDGIARLVNSVAPETELDLSGIAEDQRLNFNGKLSGPLNRLAVDGKVSSRIGEMTANVTLRNTIDSKRPFKIGGKVNTRDLDLGQIIGTESLGPLTMDCLAEATLGKDGVSLDTLSLKASRLNAMDYDYTGISVVGKYTEKAFNGRITSADPNLDFMSEGIFNLSPRTGNAVYKFWANLGYADLHALRLDPRPRSKVRFRADADFRRTPSRELVGDVRVSNLKLDSDTGQHDIGPIHVSSHSNDDIHRIQLISKFMEGGFQGEESILDFVNDLRSLTIDRHLPALTEGKAPVWEGASYRMHLKVHHAQELLDFFAPGVYIADGTSLNLNLRKDGRIDGGLTSSRLAYNGKYLKGVDILLDGTGESFQATLESSALMISGAELRDNSLTLHAKDNRIGAGYTFDNDAERATRAEVYLSGDFSRDRSGLQITAKALPSNIYYDGDGWSLSSGDIVLKGGEIKIDRLLAYHDAEHILVSGGFSPTRKDTLDVSLEKFDISLLDSVTGSSPSLSGKASGHALVLSPSKPTPGLLASIVCDSTYVSGHSAGTLNLDSHWDDVRGGFDFSLSNRLRAISNMDISGFYKPSSQHLSATAKLLQLDLGYASFLVDTIFSQFEGALSGEVSVDGRLDDLHLSSRGLRLNDGILEVDFTRVPYQTSGNLAVDDLGLHFLDMSLVDSEGGNGNLSGSLLWGGFRNMGLDTHISFDEMHVLGVPRGANPTLSGDVYGTGRVDIMGPMSSITLDIDATTTSGGSIRIPISTGGSSRQMDLLTFTEPPAPVEEDPYELLLASGTAEASGGSNLNVHLRINANQDVNVYVDVGTDMSLSCAGNGIIELDNIPSLGILDMGGNYTLTQGNFHVSVMGLVSKDFEIQDGSSIRFNGDIWDSDLDVKGVYSTKTTLASLIADETATTRRNVNCVINISDKLSNPQLGFDIEIPDLNPGTDAMVKSALNTDDKVQKQFLSLLVTGNFLPEDNSGVTANNASTVFSNVAGIMAGQMNSIFQKLDIPVDLGLNYRSDDTGNDMFDVALSTQLFNNRVIVNGNIGNKQQYGVSTNEVAGDLDVEVKVNKSGNLRLNLFSHSADQFTSYLDNSQRNGAGITYQKDFTTVREFIHQVITPREQLRQEAVDALLNPPGRVTLQVDSTGRTSTKLPDDD